MPDDYITVAQAREMLGVSRVKIAAMIKSGAIVTVPDPFDARVKLVKRADVEALMRLPHRTREDDPKIETAAVA